MEDTLSTGSQLPHIPRDPYKKGGTLAPCASNDDDSTTSQKQWYFFKQVRLNGYKR